MRVAVQVGIEEKVATTAAKLGLSWMLEALGPYEGAADELRAAVAKSLDILPEQQKEELDFNCRIGAEVFVPAYETRRILDSLAPREEPKSQVLHKVVRAHSILGAENELFETLREEIMNRDEDLRNLSERYQLLVVENSRNRKHCELLEQIIDHR